MYACGFRIYFTPLPGFFSPFPHGTCSLSVDYEYLALEVEFGVVADEVIFGKPAHKIRAGNRTIETKTLIISTGAGHRHLDVPGETELETKGVTYCATCDGALPMFRNQPLVVVGGGDSACEEATFLTRFASTAIS